MLLDSNNIKNPPLTLEITVISAQGLNNNNSSSLSSFFFSTKRLKPFATLAPTTLSSPWIPPPEDMEPHSHAHKTKVDNQGGENPTWGETFLVPFADSSLIYGAGSSSVLLRVHAENRSPGRTLLGWCHIPMADVLWPPTGSLRLLSYRLHARDGTRSHGVVNLAVRLQGLLHQDLKPTKYPSITYQASRPAIGIPVSSTLGAPAASHSKLRYC